MPPCSVAAVAFRPRSIRVDRSLQRQEPRRLDGAQQDRHLPGGGRRHRRDRHLGPGDDIPLHERGIRRLRTRVRVQADRPRPELRRADPLPDPQVARQGLRPARRATGRHLREERGTGNLFRQHLRPGLGGMADAQGQAPQPQAPQGRRVEQVPRPRKRRSGHHVDQRGGSNHHHHPCGTPRDSSERLHCPSGSRHPKGYRAVQNRLAQSAYPPARGKGGLRAR